MLLPDNHIMLTSADDVQKICKPLQNFSVPITFTYNRVYRNKTHMRLLSQSAADPLVLQHIYNEGAVYEGPFFYCDPVFPLHTGIYPVGWLYSKECLSLMHTLYNKDYFKVLTNGAVMFVIKANQYHELFAFYNDTDDSDLTHFFWQNVPLFKRFCLYFKDRAKHIIREAEKQPIDLHHGFQPTLNKQRSLPQHCKEEWKIDKRAFLRDVAFHHCHLEDPMIANIVLSQREFECAIALIRGETAQSTAAKLYLSRRTVETYIESLKNKFGCENKAALKKKLTESTVLKFYQDCF